MDDWKGAGPFTRVFRKKCQPYDSAICQAGMEREGYSVQEPSTRSFCFFHKMDAFFAKSVTNTVETVLIRVEAFPCGKKGDESLG